MRFSINTISSLLLISAFASGCGDSKESASTPSKEKAEAAPEAKATPKAEPAPPAKPEPAPEAEVTAAADGSAEVTIEVSDAMLYSHNRFTVQAGQKVRLTLKHTGTLPKEVMGHNIIILQAGVDLGQFAGLAQGAGPDKGYFPEGKDDQVVAKSELIGGGKTTVVEFTAPGEGEYDFFCSFPGHWAVMKGKMAVVAAK